MGTKLKGRARQFAQMHDKPKLVDFDPELDHAPSENDDEDNSADENAGTEHYAAVGKSKLRKNEGLTLGPKYSGTRVSRAALEDESDGMSSDNEDQDQDQDVDEDDSADNDDEEFDDPDIADIDKDAARITEDEVIDSDGAFVDSDAEFTENFTFRGSSKPKIPDSRKTRPKAADFMLASEEEEDFEDFEDAKEKQERNESEEEEASLMVVDDERSEESEEGDDDEDSEDDDSELDEETLAALEGLDGLEGLSDDDDDEEDEEEEEDQEEDDEDDESDEDEEDETTNRHFKSNNHLSALSEAAKQEVLKGQAVRNQRKLFDGLLNFRIRLQKALVSVNMMPIADEDSTVDTSEEDAAEEAALKLWSTLENIHTDLTNSIHKGSQKRKHEIDMSTATETIWGYMQEDEAEAIKHRRITLDKWSKRVGTSAAATRDRLNRTSSSICTLLDEQLTEPSRLVKRTQVPRSCAPAHTAKKIAEDENIFDDADFYQLLLKELVNQRTTETDQTAGTAVATVRWAAMKEAKTRKVVDRKASRGRKLKFTVHEKLQSFMAPEDRRQWEDDAIDRLFATLLGQQQVALDEEEHVSEDNDDNMDAEEEGLKLFRS